MNVFISDSLVIFFFLFLFLFLFYFIFWLEVRVLPKSESNPFLFRRFRLQLFFIIHIIFFTILISTTGDRRATNVENRLLHLNLNSFFLFKTCGCAVWTTYNGVCVIERILLSVCVFCTNKGKEEKLLYVNVWSSVRLYTHVSVRAFAAQSSFVSILSIILFFFFFFFFSVSRLKQV